MRLDIHDLAALCAKIQAGCEKEGKRDDMVWLLVQDLGNSAELIRDIIEDREKLLRALKVAAPACKGLRTDMLCKAGAYSDRAYDSISKEPYWLNTMADAKLMDELLVEFKKEL